jgi:adenosylcobyric acid synthase
MGRTQGPDATPWLDITQRSGQPILVVDGAVSADGRVWGCYLHGLFENEVLRRAWLSSLGWDRQGRAQSTLVDSDAAFNLLADAVEAALDMKRLEALLRL